MTIYINSTWILSFKNQLDIFLQVYICQNAAVKKH